MFASNAQSAIRVTNLKASRETAIDIFVKQSTKCYLATWFYMKISANWGEAFHDHFVKYLGAPIGHRLFGQEDAGPIIQILEFDKVFPECRVFCSFGASAYSSVLGIPAEVILPCDEGWDAASALLANSVFYLIKSGMKLGSGVALRIELIAPRLAERFGKSAIYFTNPFGLPSDFSVVNYNDETGRVYLAILISQAEFDYFCDRGAAEVESLLQRSGVDPYQMDRPSTV